MRRAGPLFIFLTFILIIAVTASLSGWFGNKKPDNPEIRTASGWEAKQAFINQCVKSRTIIDSANGNANRELQLCSCLADKVEAKYPGGLTYQEASDPSKVKELNADYCYK